MDILHSVSVISSLEEQKVARKFLNFDIFTNFWGGKGSFSEHWDVIKLIIINLIEIKVGVRVGIETVDFPTPWDTVVLVFEFYSWDTEIVLVIRDVIDKVGIWISSTISGG